MTTMDNLGVISQVKSLPGLYIGTGMLYGLTMGAAAGEALADMITGEKPKFDITPYRYERFIDGSKFEFYP
jgi:glycine/D-amino acid oxidase-like deaminating enzyme